MPAPLNLIGQRFGRLVVVERAANGAAGQTRWLCSCDCGTPTVVSTMSLRAKRTPTRSCGCLKRDADARWIESNTKHGDAPHDGERSPEYSAWAAAIQRCTNPENQSFKNYGARGISVCARWLGNRGFTNFLADMGRRPSSKHSIDRINNDGNYEPSNCRWATAKQQARNKRHRRPRGAA